MTTYIQGNGLSTSRLKQIHTKLLELLNNSYSPYSNFPVACIVKANNQYFYGVNVENSAYPNGICAEKSAISAAVSAGNLVLEEICILDNSNNFSSPCGGCRQFINEFVEPEVSRVILFNKQGEYQVLNIKQLLPLGFNKTNLI